MIKVKNQIEKGIGLPGNAKEFRDIKITAKRQLTIPKAFFDHLGIEDTVHAFLLDDGILIKPAKRRAIQEIDVELIVRNVINEGYNGNEMAEEIAYRIKKYNESVDRKIQEFLNDMEGNTVSENQGDEFNGLEIFFDQEDGKTAETN